MCKLNIECARQVKLRAHLYRKGDIGSLDNKLETHRINLEGKESTLFRKLQIALIKECKGLGLEEGSFQIFFKKKFSSSHYCAIFICQKLF